MYLDGHADMNVPGSVPNPDGVYVDSLDWMVNAHLLGFEQADRRLIETGPRSPMLLPRDLAIVDHIPEQATPFEEGMLERLSIHVVSWSDLEQNPEDEIEVLLATWGASFDHIAVHIDTDVLNFDETPISEAEGNHLVGLSLEAFQRTLSRISADGRLASVTISEIYPPHAESKPRFNKALQAFTQAIADGVATLTR